MDKQKKLQKSNGRKNEDIYVENEDKKDKQTDSQQQRKLTFM